MTSPIASPQNVIPTIALARVSRGEMSISFGECTAILRHFSPEAEV